MDVRARDARQPGACTGYLALVVFACCALPRLATGMPSGDGGRLVLERSDPFQSGGSVFLQLMDEGKLLTSERVAELEGKLDQDSLDLPNRVRLMGYYEPSARRKRGEDVRSLGPYGDLVLGIIRHHSRTRLASCTGTMLIARSFEVPDDGRHWERGREQWMRLVESHPESARILGNAGAYLTSDVWRPDQAQRGRALLERAHEVEPENPEWLEHLCNVFTSDWRLRVPRMLDEATRSQAETGLTYLEKYYRSAADSSKATPRIRGVQVLASMATVAFAAGDLEKSEAYANESLASSTAEADGWNYGNIVHDMNMLLGKIALHRGDVGKAKEYLLAAGRTPGSPQLNSFGPVFDLARELLEFGEKAAVLEYLDLVEKFWANPEKRDPPLEVYIRSARERAARLARWKEDIAAGRIPQDRKWR